jgi:hypothetical protein
MKPNEAAKVGKRFNKLCGPVKTIRIDPVTKEEVVVKTEPGKSFWKTMKDTGKDPLNYKKTKKPNRQIKKAPIKQRTLSKEEKKVRKEREDETYSQYLKSLPNDVKIIPRKKFNRLHRAGVIGSSQRVKKGTSE